MSTPRQVIGDMTTSTPTTHGTLPTGQATTGAGTQAGIGVHGMTHTGLGTGVGDLRGAGDRHGDRHGLGDPHGVLLGVHRGAGGRHGEADALTIHVIREHSAICQMARELRPQAYVRVSPTVIAVEPTVILSSTDLQQVIVPAFQPDPEQAPVPE